jgi:ribonuclease HII
MSKKLNIKEIEAKIGNIPPVDALEYLMSLDIQESAGFNRLVQKYTKKMAALDKEIARLEKMSIYEKNARSKGYKMIAGMDEAGRGPLAGPVAAACVILPEDCLIEGINDSKKLSASQREKLYDVIYDKAISVGVGIVGEKIIDEINILNATKLAMKQAVSKLSVKPDLILIDAVSLDELDIEQRSIIKGDALSISIAAASIIAKVSRDRIMNEYDTAYPEYGFSKHKGYGTEEHINAIKKYGICPIHRLSFTTKLQDYPVSHESMLNHVC